MNKNYILQMIGQLESSINSIEETDMSKGDFQDYCDHMYSCITYWKHELRKINSKIKNDGGT